MLLSIPPLTGMRFHPLQQWRTRLCCLCPYQNRSLSLLCRCLLAEEAAQSPPVAVETTTSTTGVLSKGDSICTSSVLATVQTERQAR
ncbi:hypothetical protein O6H91_06G007300 [Diphasiastrum complanatum]|uniref:Uncharacterized protein n=1 Tax=Diphasiastrum complanatum TaxID=34168 RepID=A0ACC2DAP2_DIPCM|nr:hypothetical protein O6H91_06G007300 [Diphasiastrum complanatum]